MPRKNNKKFDKKNYNQKTNNYNMYQNNNRKYQNYRYNRNRYPNYRYNRDKYQNRYNNSVPNININVSYPHIPMPVFTPYIHNNKFYQQPSYHQPYRNQPTGYSGYSNTQFY